MFNKEVTTPIKLGWKADSDVDVNDTNKVNPNNTPIITNVSTVNKVKIDSSLVNKTNTSATRSSRRIRKFPVTKNEDFFMVNSTVKSDSKQ
jgi:hypothetical protein